MRHVLQLTLGSAATPAAPAGHVRVVVLLGSELVLDLEARPDLALALSVQALRTLSAEALAEKEKPA